MAVNRPTSQKAKTPCCGKMVSVDDTKDGGLLKFDRGGKGRKYDIEREETRWCPCGQRLVANWVDGYMTFTGGMKFLDPSKLEWKFIAAVRRQIHLDKEAARKAAREAKRAATR